MLKARHDGKLYAIEQDRPEVGAYLYVYENGLCIQDYLQNDVNMCIEFAYEDFGVPVDAWQKEVSDSND